MSVANLIKYVPLFAKLELGELDQIIAICTKQELQPEELIIEQNTIGTGMYIIAEGSAEVFIQGLDDARSLVVLGQGQIFGEMAIIDQGYRSASVRATQRGASLYMIESKALYELCRKNTNIGFTIMRNLANDLAFKLRHRNLTEI